MSDMLKKRVKVVYTVGSAAEKIERQLHGVVKMVPAQTIETAVAEAAKAAAPGDVVLLSPACSSFDQFENYEHRGQVFRQSVMELD
jgi:UDP-N-acetylmuramoylalanine--D-glutamate ligase